MKTSSLKFKEGEEFGSEEVLKVPDQASNLTIRLLGEDDVVPSSLPSTKSLKEVIIFGGCFKNIVFLDDVYKCRSFIFNLDKHSSHRISRWVVFNYLKLVILSWQIESQDQAVPILEKEEKATIWAKTRHIFVGISKELMEPPTLGAVSIINLIN